MSRKWLRHPLFPNYQVSDDGMVLGRWSVLVGDRTKAGYRRYRMTDLNGRSRKYMASRLVLETFVGPPPFEGAQAAHRNGNNRDDRVENLAWKTCSENQQDKIVHGTASLGQRSNLSKLTDEQSDQAFALWGTGAYTLREIGDKYGVTPQAIWFLKERYLKRNFLLADLT